MDIRQLAKFLEDNYTEQELHTMIDYYERLNEQHKDEAALNQRAISFEKEGKTLEAIAIYESLLERKFEGSHPYNRLTIIYRKLKKGAEVVRVLESAVYVFENVVNKNRPDRLKKLEKYKADLEKEKSKQRED